MLRFLRQPLLHFVLLGSAAYFAYARTRAPEEAAPRAEIVVTAAEVRQLEELFRKTWQREPTPKERERLIEQRIREQVFYREAIAAGLDRDDAIIRRRMQQKLQFMLEDIAGEIAPTEQELQAFLDAHADRFRKEARHDFRHVYVSRDRRSDAAGDAAAILAKLEAGADPDQLGDRLLMIEPSFVDAPEFEVARSFGAGFAASLRSAPVGKWSGPIASGYGLHLVIVSKREGGRVAKLDEVRELVRREWSVAKREEMNEAVYVKLRAQYDIRVESE